MDEDDLIPLSALQHYLYCPRQCALIHVERQWEENRFTAEGRVLHETVHAGGGETRGALRIVRGLEIVSRALGIAGVADVVELRGKAPSQSITPVEYKRGRPKAHRADEVQLCAQAICLEEMFGAAIPEGALFHGVPRRRTVVAFDEGLRALTRTIADETRALLRAGRTPPPVHERRKCENCSLVEGCRPQRLAAPGEVGRWLRAQIAVNGEASCDDS